MYYWIKYNHTTKEILDFDPIEEEDIQGFIGYHKHDKFNNDVDFYHLQSYFSHGDDLSHYIFNDTIDSRYLDLRKKLIPHLRESKLDNIL
jgi:hypothetical protein